MIYYKHRITGEVYAYETEGDREQYGAPELVEMTQAETDAHLNPPPGPVPAPQQVTRAQGKAALITAGLWQNVLDYVASITDPIKKALADVALNDTSHWRRDSSFLNEAAQEIGLTDEQLDDLFRQAAEILL